LNKKKLKIKIFSKIEEREKNKISEEENKGREEKRKNKRTL
jgi:DNA invertase Pin-like site-specific DNA recombinase